MFIICSLHCHFCPCKQYRFFSFMNRIKGSYPEVISLEIERGKCVKFLFQSFTTVGFLDSPLVCYYAINVLGRRNRLNIKF